MDVYRTAQVAEILGVSTSSLRKYCIAIEKEGASFTRDERQERLYTPDDIAALKGMRRIISSGNTMVHAAHQTAILLNAEKSVKAEAGEIVVKDDRALFQQMATSITELTEQVESMRREQAIERAHIRAIVDMDVMDELKEEVKTLRAELAEVRAEDNRGLLARIFGKRKS